MKPPRYLTSWLCLSLLLLLASLFIPLSWPNVLIVSAQVLTLFAIIWLFYWVKRADRVSLQLVVLTFTALTAVAWMFNSFSILSSESNGSVLGPSPLSLIATIIELLLLGFTTYLTFRLHLNTEKPLSDL